MRLLPAGLSLALFSSALSSPVPLSQRGDADTFSDASTFAPIILLDYSVPLTYPTAGTVWQAGQEAYITWNATLPPSISPTTVAQTALLLLGYTSPTSDGLHLDLDNPLGKNISLYSAPSNYSFSLPPDLPSRTTYILSFQGSSGNISPPFTILARNNTWASSSEAPASASGSVPSSTGGNATRTAGSAAVASAIKTGAAGIQRSGGVTGMSGLAFLAVVFSVW